MAMAYRVTPRWGAENDTARYLDGMFRYCEGRMPNTEIFGQLPNTILLNIGTLGCTLPSENFFLFVLALFTPLPLLLCCSWSRGSWQWSWGLLLSVYGLELMTNAMRQSLGMAFFMVGLACLHQKKRLGLILGCVGAVIHLAVLPYLPLLVLLVAHRQAREGGKKSAFWAVSAGTVCTGVYLANFGGEPVGVFVEVVAGFRVKYAEILGPDFLLFMVAPLILLQGSRYLDLKKFIVTPELLVALYSTMIIVASLIYTPYITYRLAIFAVPLQIFMVCLADDDKRRSGAVAFVGLCAHALFMEWQIGSLARLYYG